MKKYFKLIKDPSIFLTISFVISCFLLLWLDQGVIKV